MTDDARQMIEDETWMTGDGSRLEDVCLSPQSSALGPQNDPDQCYGPEWYDELEAEDKELCPERLARQHFAEAVYQMHADATELCRSCEAECRRNGRCAYLRTGRNGADDIQPVGYNLRVRFMPLCIARTADARLMAWLRHCSDRFLR